VQTARNCITSRREGRNKRELIIKEDQKEKGDIWNYIEKERGNEIGSDVIIPRPLYYISRFFPSFFVI
jgi:hypothetical protein